mmetsp:Transcript_41478/g.109472  ORF Transcript_41478/g.109472 Transcript_41478/m.109472 type:complete len:86 (+) Transcript_41478:308-565(+)
MPIMSSAPAAEAPPHALADDEPEAVLECERLLLSSPPPSPPPSGPPRCRRASSLVLPTILPTVDASRSGVLAAQRRERRWRSKSL